MNPTRSPAIPRRTFLVMISGGLLAAPLASAAQQAGRIPKIAFITTTAPGGSPTTDAFRGGLRDLGYIEGQNIIVEWRWGRGTTERFAEFAAEVVGLKVDVIVEANSPAGRAAQKATRTIPIVIPTMADPVGDGSARACGGGLPHVLRREPRRPVSAYRSARQPNPKGCETSRPSRGAAHKVRAGHQSQNCQGTWADDSAITTPAGRRLQHHLARGSPRSIGKDFFS